jgi:hypothetical protein
MLDSVSSLWLLRCRCCYISASAFGTCRPKRGPSTLSLRKERALNVGEFDGSRAFGGGGRDCVESPALRGRPTLVWTHDAIHPWNRHADREANSSEGAQGSGPFVPMATLSSIQCRQPNPRLPRSSGPKLFPRVSPEKLSCSPWQSVIAVPSTLMMQTHQ